MNSELDASCDASIVKHDIWLHSYGNNVCTIPGSSSYDLLLGTNVPTLLISSSDSTQYLLIPVVKAIIGV